MKLPFIFFSRKRFKTIDTKLANIQLKIDQIETVQGHEISCRLNHEKDCHKRVDKLHFRVADFESRMRSVIRNAYKS